MCYFECFPHIIRAELVLTCIHCKDLCILFHIISTSSNTLLYNLPLLPITVANALIVAIILIIKSVITIDITRAVLTFVKVWFGFPEVALAINLIVIAVE